MRRDIYKFTGWIMALALVALDVTSATRGADSLGERYRVQRYYECCYGPSCYGPNGYVKRMNWWRTEPCGSGPRACEPCVYGSHGCDYRRYEPKVTDPHAVEGRVEPRLDLSRCCEECEPCRKPCLCQRCCFWRECLVPGAKPPCEIGDICLYHVIFPMSPWYSNPRDGIMFPAYGSKSPTCVPEKD